jgi:hypothetical protein
MPRQGENTEPANIPLTQTMTPPHVGSLLHQLHQPHISYPATSSLSGSHNGLQVSATALSMVRGLYSFSQYDTVRQHQQHTQCLPLHWAVTETTGPLEMCNETIRV